MLDYLEALATDFVELHGDRLYGDDPAVVGGPARISGRTVMVVGQQKGRDTKEKLYRNFGMAHPEGYRKALRLMRQAEKFRWPVLTLVDTPAAFSGPEAEERGQAMAIAQNLAAMAGLRTPLLAVIIGEGGSGGALALALADRLLMQENAIYSVISPEACAAILWRDASKKREAAHALRLTAQDALAMGIVDEVVPEPEGGAHNDPSAAAAELREAVRRHLDQLVAQPMEALLGERYQRYRSIGPLRNPRRPNL
jgi:acetyl-CoA carboxylase carboxyl transferase subunit alpha